MMKKITLLFAITILSAKITLAQSFTAVYTFDSVKTTSGLTDPSAVPTATGATFGSFSATGTSANSTAAERFSFTGWPTGATTGNDSYSSLTGTPDPLKYYSVTITPLSGYNITISSITFKTQRSASGIRTYAVRSSVDGFATNLPASISPANTKLSVQTGNVFYWKYDSITSGQNGSTITLTGSGFTNITSAITFGFGGSNAELTGGTFSIDTVKFTGTASTTTSITDLSGAAAISVYPNPSADGLFIVDLGNPAGKTVITVYNIIGKIILSKELNSGGKQPIDLSKEANGSYFLNIKNDNSTITRKITVNK